MPRVEFGRINRRLPEEQGTLDMRPFREDMLALAASRETYAEVAGRTWIAADMTLDPSETFLTGILGFSDEEELTDFEQHAFSWLKGPTKTVAGASRRTMVPFAIDLRDKNRWVAFAVSQRIRAAAFGKGFQIVLNRAVAALKLLPAEWDVNIVSSPSHIEDWLEEHPEVVRFVRIVRIPNPRRIVDEDREKMQALDARVKREEFRPYQNETLSVRDSPLFQELISGTDTGDVAVELHARAVGRSHPRFRSDEHADETHVRDFGADLQTGMELILDALRNYAEQRADSGS